MRTCECKWRWKLATCSPVVQVEVTLSAGFFKGCWWLQEKKPLKERLKESAVKGIDKVQAALGQANERVTGVK